jgi:hypothetical protein
MNDKYIILSLAIMVAVLIIVTINAVQALFRCQEKLKQLEKDKGRFDV